MLLGAEYVVSTNRCTDRAVVGDDKNWHVIGDRTQNLVDASAQEHIIE